MQTPFHAGPPWPVPDEDIYGEWSWLTDDDSEEELLAGLDDEDEAVADAPESKETTPGDDKSA